ncbi:hypothetical protein ACFE04_030849 [Oxalis oulophora]
MTIKVNILLISLVALLASTTNAADYDVTKYGGKPDSDLSPALLAAWKEACSCTEPSNVVIPKGNFKMNEVLLEGPCKAPIKITLAGTILANADPEVFTKNAWISINRVNQLTLLGGGVLDGQGLAAWKTNQCTKNVNCDPHPLNLALNFLNDSIIQDITSKDSKGFHINNGVRIKSWPAREAGEASDIHFEDITMNNVSNPIIIDQVYCPWNQCDKGVRLN